MKLGRLLATGLITGALVLGASPSYQTYAQTNPGKVVVDGLNSPRGLGIDSSGNLYVTDSGTGGPNTFTIGDLTLNYGNTAKIYKIAPDGTKSVAVDGLLSTVSPEGEVGGPSDVVYANSALWITGGYLPTGVMTPTFGVLKADMSTGAVSLVADLGAFEAANNPDGFAIDSNPYGMALGQDGMLYVADAGANALIKVDPASGEVSLVTVFPGIPLPESPETANPDRNGAYESDPVPTGVAVAEDGHIFVGFLTGFPFADGAASIAHVDHDGEFSTAVSGLTMVTDVVVGPDDAIYASEFGTFSFTSTPPGFQPGSGKVVRNLTNGTTEVIAGGLDQTNGLALSPGGDTLYVVTHSNDAPGTGQVLSFSTSGSGAPIGMPVTGAGSFPIEALIAALLLVAAGTLLRTNFARKSN